MLSETLFFFSSWILGPLNYNPPLFKPTNITRHSLTISVMRLRYYWTHTIYPCILVGTENMIVVLISPHLGFFTRLPVSEFFASSAVSSISRAFSLIFLKKKKKMTFTCTGSCSLRRTFEKLASASRGSTVRADAGSSRPFSEWHPFFFCKFQVEV